MSNIRLNDITKIYGDVKAVTGITLDVPATSAVVLLGPSGSGKTTLLRLIAGLEIPDGGQVYINGEMVSQPGWAVAPHLRGLGFMFQTSALWPHMTVAQNILFGLHMMSKKDARDRLQELLEKTGLNGLERRYPNQISGGEARRVALARTLAPQPRCVLLDEPLTSVDEDQKGHLVSLVKEEIRLAEACLIYVTHDTDEANHVSDRVVTIRNGFLEE